MKKKNGINWRWVFFSLIIASTISSLVTYGFILMKERLGCNGFNWYEGYLLGGNLLGVCDINELHLWLGFAALSFFVLLFL